MKLSNTISPLADIALIKLDNPFTGEDVEYIGLNNEISNQKLSRLDNC